jgi:N-acetylmuramoyl-L-alanine amidase
LLDADFCTGCLDNKNTIDNTALEPKPKEIVKPAESVKNQVHKEKTKESQLPKEVKKTETAKPIGAVPDSGEKVWFTVQVAASTNPISIEPVNFKGESSIQEKKIGAYYKYFAGSFANFEQATEERKRLIAKFPGAFIVAFKGHQPIAVDEARKI